LRFFTLPYDTEAAVRETEAQHGLPNGHLFVSELKTGIYAPALSLRRRGLRLVKYQFRSKVLRYDT
jgi:hypothetical protein